MQTQRMILWIVFSMSLWFLWDSWQRHQGHPSLFGGATPQATAPAASGNGKPRTDATMPPSTSAPAGTATACRRRARRRPVDRPPRKRLRPRRARAAAATSGQVIRLANDVLALDVNPVGGQIQRAELLHHRDLNDRAHNLVLLQSLPGKLYVAQSGLIGAADGPGYPNHRTPMTPVDGNAGPHVLAAGGDAVKLTPAAERRRAAGAHLHAGGARVRRRREDDHQRRQRAGAAGAHMQLTRDGNPPPGESKFYSTYTGPVVLHRRRQVPEGISATSRRTRRSTP